MAGKNKNEICFSGFKSFIEFSAALKAALYPLSSPSKQIIMSSKNWFKVYICLSVNDVPKLATTFSIPFLLKPTTSIYPSTK